jgi:predicted nucleic acid-binding protein
MSGNRIFVDTNIFQYLLEGSDEVALILDNAIVYISVINQIEILCWKKFNKSELSVIHTLLENLMIIHTNDEIARRAVMFRKTYNIKLPDAIIAATCYYHNLPLLTADTELFKIKEINIIAFTQ